MAPLMLPPPRPPPLPLADSWAVYEVEAELRRAARLAAVAKDPTKGACMVACDVSRAGDTGAGGMAIRRGMGSPISRGVGGRRFPLSGRVGDAPAESDVAGNGGNAARVGDEVSDSSAVSLSGSRLPPRSKKPASTRSLAVYASISAICSGLCAVACASTVAVACAVVVVLAERIAIGVWFAPPAPPFLLSSR